MILLLNETLVWYIQIETSRVWIILGSLVDIQCSFPQSFNLSKNSVDLRTLILSYIMHKLVLQRYVRRDSTVLLSQGSIIRLATKSLKLS
jgi:hypothetical protein